MKCYKCAHWYVMMTGQRGYGYNPYPCCHLSEDTGKRPNILTQECFKKRKKATNKMKVQYIGTGILKSEDGKIFYCDYGECGGYVISDTDEIYEITKRDKNDNPIEIQITEICKLIKGFYYDLNLFRTTNKDIYLTCVKHTLNKIIDRGYTDVYLTLSKVL